MFLRVDKVDEEVYLLAAAMKALSAALCMRARLSAAIRVIYPEDFETLGVAVPIDHQHFQYTSKHVAVPTAGRVRRDCWTRSASARSAGCS